MTVTQYEVWSIPPPGKSKKLCMGEYELPRWQFALKHAQFLRDHDHSDVEIRTVKTEVKDEAQ